jgi:hypothetical protein
MDFTHVTLANIERWASTSELDALFEALRDDDQLLTFAKNRNSAKRQFFASGLVERLVFHLYAPHDLP